MDDISPSIWQQDNKGEWKLYFNTENEMSSSLMKNPEQSKLIKNNNISEKNFVLGTLVMTPNGIGRIIKNSNILCTINFNQEKKEKEFSVSEISNYFNCLLTELLQQNINIIRIKLKANGKVEDIFEELKKIEKIDAEEENNYSFVYNGMLLKKDYTFEQLNIKNNCKFLLLKKQESIYSISRFTSINKYWFTFTIDGICINPSETIKLIGMGFFGSYENKTVSAVLRILDGANINNKVLLEENLEISPSPCASEAIIKIFFNKPITLRKNEDYAIILHSKLLTNSYCGHGGKKMVEGENGISFTFKKIEGRNCGTNIETGNFPEFYYYTN